MHAGAGRVCLLTRWNNWCMSSRTRRTWLPNQHGAWAMITAPPLIGLILAGPEPVHVPLLLAWWLGYFAYFSLTVWLHSGGRRRARRTPRSRRNQRPLIVFGVLATVALAITVTLAPHLIPWALVYLPLAAIAVVESRAHRDRGVLNDTVTVLAAGLMTVVAWSAATGAGPLQVPVEIWVVTAAVTWYFLGTIAYVKTNIRERDSRGWLIGSVVFHLVGLTGAIVAHSAAHTTTAHIAVWGLLTVRAAAIPLLRRGLLAGVPARRWPMIIGIGEVLCTGLVAVTLLLGALR